MLFNILPNLFYLFRTGCVDFVDYGNIGHDHIGFPWIIEELMAGAMRIKQHYMNIRREKGSIVVATVPEDAVEIPIDATRPAE